MIDTQQLQDAPKCVSGVAEVAATLARADDAQCTHAIEVTTCFPLDIETVGRMLEGLGERAGIDMIQSDGVCYLNFERPDDYNLRMLDLDAGEHLESNNSLLKHLSVLRGDESWMRKVKEQHELLLVVANARFQRVELSYFTSRTDIPSARIQSTLNDLGASGFIFIDIDEDAGDVYYVFPSFSYPKARYNKNMRLLEELTPREPEQHTSWLLVALALAVFIVLVFAMLP